MAALAWQVDLGVTEVIGEAPVNRYDLTEAVSPAMRDKPAAVAVAVATQAVLPVAMDAVAAATRAALICDTPDALRAALAGFDLCDLKKGARALVFAAGNPQARLMIIGDAPDRDEDRQGVPFAGRAGQLLDKMLAAIGLSRDAEAAAGAAYLTTALPWRPAADREPTASDIAILQPFLARHVELIRPAVVIAMGNTACAALLGQRGLARLRGQWADFQGIPVLPMTHPSALLRTPSAKREAWADLLAVQARLTILETP